MISCSFGNNQALVDGAARPEACYRRGQKWNSVRRSKRGGQGHDGRVYDNIFVEQLWRRLRGPWFDMDGFEIVAPEASGEAVFSGFTLRWLSALIEG